MSKKRWLLAGLIASLAMTANAGVIDQKLDQYRAAGATTFSADAGQALWNSDNDGRSCTQCHGADPTGVGKHAKTGKAIKPMAPSVNPKRFTDSKKIDKWFLRNCKWTLNRECTAQEKGDFLVWIRGQ
ncbi:protein of unknown function [Amphritea atlantica]|jgi:hypothetical protein|uniref:Cytochrome c domain-containing protein n=1 Tax=Amphritea atlantica TaxID=355243 RepID=A0A1H9CM27_9GAMM|nr:DUF1924 domain-containing protein [Amphritea atlantica]SEQ02219.1 protein of unknown function [Amphritea atlantica]